MSSTLINNIGEVVTGNLTRPRRNIDSIFIEDGVIRELGSTSNKAKTVVDANGLTLTPGFIDAHTHPLLGGFTPRQNTLGWCESYLHGGITSMVSAGECHVPGRPTDPEGLKALAVLTRKSFDNHRPGGVKVRGGTLLLSDNLTESDIQNVHEAGVKRMKFLFAVDDLDRAENLVKWGSSRDMISMMHCGGSSLPGTKSITADMFMKIRPAIAAHFNGGPTPLPDEGLSQLIEETEMVLELIVGGNQRVAVDTLETLDERGELHRIHLGTDTPTGTGVIPCGILLEMSILAGLTQVSAAEVVCLATGSVADHHDLETGIVGCSRPADLCLLDAPKGSAAQDALGALNHGEYAAVDKVLVDGEVLVEESRNTPPGKRSAEVNHI